MYRMRGTNGTSIYNQRICGTSVRLVDASVRLPRHSAHPRALHGRADRARAERATRAHRPAHTGKHRPCAVTHTGANC